MVRTGVDITVVVMPGPATEPVSLLTIAYAAWVINVPFGSGLATRTTSCTEPEAPAASAPIDQVTTEPDRVPPAVALTNAVLAGTVSLITTPVAVTFPEFEYDSVYVRVAPAATGSGASVAVTVGLAASTVGVAEISFEGPLTLPARSYATTVK